MLNITYLEKIFDVNFVKDMLVQAGWFLSILVLGGWLFIPISIIVLIYYLFLYPIKRISK